MEAFAKSTIGVSAVRLRSLEANVDPAVSSSRRRFEIWRCGAIFAATLLAYFPALTGALLWNDNDYVTQPQLRSLQGLGRIWFKLGATEQYYPLLHSAFWVEHRLWGDSPLGYHLVNVLLHATSACLLALVVTQLFGVDETPACAATLGSGPVAERAGVSFSSAPWLAALLFALHPVCVESVAWISEQKNTLSLVFYLSAALAYLRFEGGRRPLDFRPPSGAENQPRRSSRSASEDGWPAAYLLATAFFLLALLTKSVTATLPAALLVVIWWRRGTLSWKRDIRALVPWFILGAASGLFSAWVERRYVGAVGAGFGLTAVQRFLVAGRVIWFYLGKLLWPANLNFIYPRWMVSTAAPVQYLFPLGAVGLTLVLARMRGRSRGPLAAWLFFAGSLFPVLGFFNVYAFIFSYVADHFQYLAALGIIVLAAVAWERWEWAPPSPAGSALARLWRTGCGFRRMSKQIAAGAVICLLGILTWRQCRMYRDLSTFYETILARNPACWMAHNNLGNVLRGLDRKAEAIRHYERALQLRPDYPEAHLNLALTLSEGGRLDEAVAHDEEALRLRPIYPAASLNLGLVLMQLGRFPEAIAQFGTALRIDPDYADAHYDLGAALVKVGRVPEAIAQFAEAARLNPGQAEAHHNLANGLLQLGRDREAQQQFAEALRLEPDNAEAHNGLGDTLFDLGRFEDARGQFVEALRCRPDYAEAHNNLGNALAQLNRMSESVAEFKAALRLNPNYADAYNNLAITLDQMGRVTEAAEQFGRALELRPESPEAHNNFGNVLRQLGRFAEARKHYEEALRLRPNYPEARDNLARLPAVR